ncbi:MAG: M48 family metallopeptidase [Anaerolineaceae bacterium]
MISVVVIGIIVLMFVFDLAVTLVNYQHRKQPISPIVQDIYDQEKYAKWLNYSMETTRFEIIVNAISTILILCLLVFGVFGILERWTNGWFQNDILRTLSFLGVYFIFSSLINLPFAYYETFVIEEKYGFNKSTPKTFFIDQLKSLLVSAILFGVLLGVLNVLYLTFIDRLWLFILTAWGILSAVIVVINILNTKVFIRIFNKLTPLPDGTLKKRIESLAAKVGFNVTAISIMDASRRSTKLNGFFSGIGKTREVVLFDTLLDRMTEDEIIAVLAHELGHAVHKDIPRQLIRQIFLFGVYAALIGWILQSAEFSQAFGVSGPNFGFSLILFSILISPISLLIGIPLNALSRKAESAADAFSAQYADQKSIFSALRTLAQENLADLNPHPFYVLMHYTHPPLADRLQAIKQLTERQTSRVSN